MCTAQFLINQFLEIFFPFEFDVISDERIVLIINSRRIISFPLTKTIHLKITVSFTWRFSRIYLALFSFPFPKTPKPQNPKTPFIQIIIDIVNKLISKH